MRDSQNTLNHRILLTMGQGFI